LRQQGRCALQDLSRRILIALTLAGLASAAPDPCAARPSLVLWAWERPEDLRAAGPDVGVAILTGFIELSGERITARPRRFPVLTAPGAARTALVHLQIDQRRPLAWTADLRARTAAAVVALARPEAFTAVQVDFEVRASQRQMLLDVLHDVRAALPRGTTLSMTALASWCESEDWLGQADVDEVAPMLFRMGRGGTALKAKLEGGGDFANPKCRTALALSTDTPLARIPPDRRIYLFNPRSWSQADLARALRTSRP
jgi:hypothetical protein